MSSASHPTPLEIARNIRSRGLWPTPVNGKRPVIKGWQERQIDPATEPEMFNGRCTGAGIVLGISGMMDLEADCEAARYVLDAIAPDTGCVWHRAGRPHRLYACANHAAKKWQIESPGDCPESVCLVELRGGPQQSVFPGSAHPDGGLYEWVTDGNPAEVPYADLQHAATLAGAAGALGLYWPKPGARHEAALAVAGYLRRAGVTEKEATVIMRAATLAAKDSEAEDRIASVRTTFSLGPEAPFTGLPKLAELCGATVAGWLQQNLPAASAQRNRADFPADDPATDGSDEGPPPSELLIAAASHDGAQRADFLRQLAQAVADDPLEADRYATLVSQQRLAPKKAFEAAVAGARRDSRRAERSVLRDSNAAVENPYCVLHGRIHHRRLTKEGSIDCPLCNFDVRILEEQIRDDGAERSAYFTVGGRLDTGEGLHPVSVPAERFASMSWVTGNWGASALVFAGMGTKDHLRVAIQSLSSDITRRTIFCHLGWRKIEGTWLYLHAGGAIGPNGPVTGLEVDLGDAKLSSYSLPHPPEGEALRKAVSATLSFLRLAGDEITLPLLAAVYRAVLCEFRGVDFSVFISGPTGSQKTELTAAIQAHFGSLFHGKNLPANWSSSPNSLEREAFLAKDGILTIDDFAPSGTAADVARLHQAADRLFRAQGNRSGRGRMRADGSLRPEYHPRGLVVSSGEDLPNGESIRARLVILELSCGDVNLAHLTRVQELARDGVLANALAGFVQWVARAADSLPRTLQERQEALRSEFRRVGAGHDRTPDNIASLFIGLEQFVSFAADIGALSAEEAEDLERRGRQSFASLARSQAGHQAGEEPTSRFIELVVGALTSGLAHVADARTEGPPADPHRWGWRKSPSSDSATVEVWVPQGRRIGWTEGENIFLDPEASFATAQRLAHDQSGNLPIHPKTLWKRMAQKKLLASNEESQDRNLVRCTIGNRRPRVLHLHMRTVFPGSGPIGPSGQRNQRDARDGTDSKDRCDEDEPEIGPRNRSPIPSTARHQPRFGPDGPIGPLLAEGSPYVMALSSADPFSGEIEDGRA